METNLVATQAQTQVVWVIHGQETNIGSLERHPSQLCARDVKALWSGPPCLFLFKTSGSAPTLSLVTR